GTAPQSYSWEKILRKRPGAVAQVRSRWASEYDLHLLPANGRACQTTERREPGLDASGRQADGVECAAVVDDGLDLYLGHPGSYERKESVWPQCALGRRPYQFLHDPGRVRYEALGRDRG